MSDESIKRLEAWVRSLVSDEDQVDTSRLIQSCPELAGAFYEMTQLGLSPLYMRATLVLMARVYFKIIENVATSPIGWTDLDLNGSYLSVIKAIESLLEDPEFNGLAKSFQRPDHIFPSSQIDILWDSGLRETAEGFLASVQAYLVGLESGKRRSPALSAYLSWLRARCRPWIDKAEAFHARAESAFGVLVESLKETFPRGEDVTPHRRSQMSFDDAIKKPSSKPASGSRMQGVCRKGRRRKRASSELSGREQTVYQMVHIQGKTPKEVAIELQCSDQNVYKLLKKAERKVNARRSRSINLGEAGRLPEDKRGQVNIGVEDEAVEDGGV